MNWYDYENGGLPNLIIVLQNTVAAMGHSGPLLPSSFKFPFSIGEVQIIWSWRYHNTIQNIKIKIKTYSKWN